jgi:cytochrome c-type biogenesis protein CcmH
MLFWVIAAAMTGAATFAVLWPLSRARAPAPDREADLAVYRDQLAEVERDRARGLLTAPEAEAARIEVSRRLLAADAAAKRETPAAAALGRRRAAAVLTLATVPVFALGLYAAVGSPGLPDAPLAARLQRPPEQMDVAVLVQRIETHLAQNPNDGRGWELLAPIYLRQGRADDAVRAQTNALKLLGANAEREADLGEALVVQAGGVVKSEARAAFERALTQDAAHAKALFFLGLAAEQDGRAAEALSRWRELAEKAAADDPWRILAVRRTAELEGARR